MAVINKIFIKNELLEKLEESKKGILDSNLILKLKNNLVYQLTPAVKFNKTLSGDNKLENKFFTYDELSKYNYDLYQGTAIIDELTVYSYEEGFSGIIIKEKLNIKTLEETEHTRLIKKQIKISIKEHEELRKIMLSIGNNFSRETCDCFNVNILLEHFIKVLGVHLDKENDFLYNDFKNNPKLKSLTSIYISSMNLTNSIVLAYYQKWNNNIVDLTKNDFLKETKDIIRILNDRIQQEENVLFPSLLED